MFLPSPSALRDRLDRLSSEAPDAPTLWDRLQGNPDAHLPDVKELLALDRDLERAGVHTLADARLLGRLASGDPRARHLHQGLEKRTARAAAEFGGLLNAVDRHRRLHGGVSASQMEHAEALYRRLCRALEIVEFLRKPEKTAPERLFVPLVQRGRRLTAPQNAILATVEYFLQRSQEQAVELRSKRRHLDRAHEMLLSLAVELGPDRVRAQALRTQVAEEGHRLQALETFVRPNETVPQAIRRAVDSGEGQTAYRGLMAMYRGALESDRADLAGGTRAALEALWTRLDEVPATAMGQDGQRRLAEKLGEGALAKLWREKSTHAERDALLEAAYGLNPDQWSVYELAVSAGEFFDTGEMEEIEEGDGAMAAAAKPMNRVPYPTSEMGFTTAKDMIELPHFVISDPRMVLYDFASGTQLVRAYYESPEEKPKKTRRSAVRVYVCDASGSMRGHRARFRDAVLVAELNNLSLKAQQKQIFWPIYYSFFNDQPMPLRRVDSAQAAYDAIAELFEHSPAKGRTDITFALESAFAAIHEARGRDPDLARATVVVLTDGEDTIDVDRIEAARHPVGDIEITLNFISLGDGNADLRGLVLEQRRAGRRAFYSHLSDPELAAGASLGGSELRTLLPELPELKITADDPEIRRALDALERVAAGAEPGSAGPAPSTRFEAYFPEAVASHPGKPSPSDRERVLDILGAVAEAVALASATDRPSEAVELVEHLLRVYGFELERYLHTLIASDPEMMSKLKRVRLLAAGFRGTAWVESDVPAAPLPDPAQLVETLPILPAAS